jgi:TetR/AcrR family transcriptional repressor of mexJK operon
MSAVPATDVARLAPSTPRAERLRRRFVEAATEELLRCGYAGMKTDAIARRAVGSKATLYRLFRDKEAILEAVVADIRLQFAPSDLCVPPGADAREFLREFAASAARAVLSERSMAIHRAIAARVPDQPAVGESFWSAGPEQGLRKFAELLAKLHARGGIHCPDPDAGALEFNRLLLGGVIFEAIIGGRPVPAGAALEAHARRVVDVFVDGVWRRR